MFAELVVLCTAITFTEAPTDFNVLPGHSQIAEPQSMMTMYLLAKIAEAEKAYREAYEKRTDVEEIKKHQEFLKQEFLRRIGGLPERTPLNPQIVGRLERRGYRVEKIIFESQPKHFVTAALFLPDPNKFKPPYAAVLVPCGHSNEAKGYRNYAGFGALCALNGLAALVFDPVDQGERHQWRDADGKFTLWGTAGHNMIGVGSILLGRNTARFEIWDGMRAIDYLQSREDINPEKIGCSGISGGGTQTAYLMALDPRIKAAAPGCYICSLYGRLIKTNGPQDAEQNIYGQLALGMDHADYCIMRAPAPTLLLTATKDYFNIEDAWASFRMAKRVFGRLGYPERIDLAETDAEHGFSIQLREASTRFMLRWLLGRDEVVFEPADIDVPTAADLQCTPQGEVMLLEGARSVYDLNRDYAKELLSRRAKIWQETPQDKLLEKVAQIAGLRSLAALPQPEVVSCGTLRTDAYDLEKLILRPEPGIELPALLFKPREQQPSRGVIYIHEEGKAADAGPGGPIEKLVQEGKVVLAVDLRGLGETQRTGQTYFRTQYHGPDGKDFYLAYHLEKSYVGMRAEDLLVAARWIKENRLPANATLEVISVGYLNSVALHAAVRELGLFDHLTFIRPLVSWHNVVELGFSKNRLVNTVHGALEVYDLPDLVRVLSDRVKIENPQDAMGQPWSGQP
ncbi:MAG: alpha/beta hydrolase family protein [Thermogutta sp.]